MLRWFSALVLGSVLVGGAATPSTAQAGQWQYQNGYSYYRGDDGRWYCYVNDACYVWDGVAWRPCNTLDNGYADSYPGYGYSDYGYSQPYYGGYAYNNYGYLPYSRSYAYFSPLGGFHHQHFGHHIGPHHGSGHFHSGIGHPGHVGHGNVGHGHGGHGHSGHGHGGHGHRH